MREKICCIYRITSKVHPDRIYIGSTVDFHNRVRTHKYQLKKQTHHNIKLQSHADKYGVEDFTFEIVEIVNVESNVLLIQIEQSYLDLLHPYLNINTIADRSLGVKRSEETKRKVGAASKGHKMPDHVKELLVSINKGSHITEEHKKAISEAQSKPKPYMVERNKGNKYGKANKGRKMKKPSPFKGKKKDKPSPLKGRKTGRTPANVFKKGNRTWNTGMKLPYTPHPKQSEAMKKYWERKKKMLENDQETEKGNE